MTANSGAIVRQTPKVIASELASLLYVISIGGAVIACGFNIYVFRDWNLNYFQVASVADIFMSSANVIFAILMLIFPSIGILLFSCDFSYNIRRRRIHFLQRFDKLYSRRAARFISNWALGTAGAAFYIFLFVVMLSQFESERQPFPIAKATNISWGMILFLGLLSIFLGLFAALGTFRGITLWNIRFPVFGFLLVVFYAIFWSVSFVNPYTYRWYGFFGEQHIVAHGRSVAGCDSIYLRWMGENKTVLECWRDKRASEQILYVFDNQSGSLYGPVQGRLPVMQRSVPQGPSPPPIDRLTPEQAKRAYYPRPY